MVRRRRRTRRTGGLHAHPKVVGYVCNICGSGNGGGISNLLIGKTNGMYVYAPNRGWGSKALAVRRHRRRFY